MGAVVPAYNLESIKDPLTFSGPVLAAINMVPGALFVADGPQLIVLSAANAGQLFSYTEPSGQIFYGPATVGKVRVWIGNTDGSLRAFALTS